MVTKTRYAQVGVGSRARLYYEAIVSTFKDTSTLVGICDLNQTRMNFVNRILKDEYDLPAVPTYSFDQFEEMIEKRKPDVILVSTIDRTHHRYIIRAMELGCDVITEKPLTTDETKCQAILDAVNRTGRNLRVIFNYRYAPHVTKVRELVMNDAIGKIFSIHFEWLLDVVHGADYFRRWHRDKKNSGGLLVHKSTHHFDMINFWLDSRPRMVMAFADLNFYGRENAEKRGITRFYSRAHGSREAKDDPFALHMAENETLKALYLEAEQEDGYHRDQSVFGDGISIEDTMGVLVRYSNNTIMTYSLNAYMPWEGYRVSLNGNKGRIELLVKEDAYVSAGGEKTREGSLKEKHLFVHPLFEKPYEIDIPIKDGGHGGGDPILLNDLFGIPEEDVYKRAASHIDGVLSVLTGIAANNSIRTGQPVSVDDLVRLPPQVQSSELDY